MRVHASDHLFGNVDLYLVYLQSQNPARTSWKIGTKLSNANAFACALMSKTLGITAQLCLRPSPNLLPHPCSYKRGKYIQYSRPFITFV